MKNLKLIAFTITIFLSIPILSQNVRVAYSKKAYSYTKKDDAPTFNYKLIVSKNGNVLSLTSYDKRVLKYVFLDSTGNELYNGGVEAIKYPKATALITYVVIKEHFLRCYGYINNIETKTPSIFCLVIDMHTNELISEKLITEDTESKSYFLLTGGDLLSESLCIAEANKVSETKTIYNFMLIDENHKVTNSYKLETQNNSESISYSIRFQYYPHQAIVGYIMIKDKNKTELNQKDRAKIVLYKVDLKSNSNSYYELPIDFPVTEFISENIKSTTKNIEYKGYDMTTKVSKTLNNITEYHIYGLLELNIEHLNLSKLSYLNTESIDKFTSKQSQYKRGFSSYLPYTQIMLESGTMPVVILNETGISSSKNFGSFLMNTQYELADNKNHFIFDPQKKAPNQLDIASSASNKGYYLIDWGRLTSDEITHKSQKKQDYYIIYHINDGIVTRSTISEDPENSIQNSFLKGSIWTFEHTRNHNLKYDTNEARNIFCYMLKNDKTQTYKYVWLYFK